MRTIRKCFRVQIGMIMSKNSKRLIKLIGAVTLTGVLFSAVSLVPFASATSYLQNLNAGAATVLDFDDEDEGEAPEGSVSLRSSSIKKDSKKSTADQRESGNLTEKLQELDVSFEELNTETEDKEAPADDEGSKTGDSGNSKPVIEVEYPDDLVMANVQDAVNVRSEPSEDSERVGKLYRDCAGQIIERKNGWTYLKSGKVKGWTKDEYLLFGDEARELAQQVGNLVAKVHADGLRVRKEPNEESGIWGFVIKDEELNAIEVVDDVWVSVEYEGEKGFVYAEYTTISFVLDDGETMQQIKDREDKEAAEKRKSSEEKANLNKNRGAVAVEASDEVLLGALIQCEAGNQSYEGQLAVGAVVMNRVRSGGYPGTVSGVIYASGQFTPAQNGRLASAINIGVKSSCMQAAREAIAGVSNVGGATHFRRAGSQQGIVIGAHVFW